MHESALGCLECTESTRMHESALGCLECTESTRMHESALGCLEMLPQLLSQNNSQGERPPTRGFIR